MMQNIRGMQRVSDPTWAHNHTADETFINCSARWDQGKENKKNKREVDQELVSVEGSDSWRSRTFRDE